MKNSIWKAQQTMLMKFTQIKWAIFGRNTFSRNSLFKVLIDENSYIIHCASNVPYSGTPETQLLGPIEKLLRVLSRKIEISCSTIRPIESFINGDCTGPLGVIIVPKKSDSITKLGALDIGSSVDPTSRTGRRTTILKPLAIENVINSIKDKIPSHYNEWNIYEYTVVGVVILGPLGFALQNGSNITITQAQLYSSFPECRFFGHSNNDLIELKYNHNNQAFEFKRIIEICEIYRIT